MKYPKIDTLWKRDRDNKFKIIEGRYSREEFDNIELWEITEKIDGMNIRVMWNGDNVTFGGRTDKAIIPEKLMKYLKEIFTIDIMKKTFYDSKNVILFGEGYGKNIQKAGIKYSDNNQFILFDICIDDWWLERNNVDDIAAVFNIKSVPTLGIMDKDEIVKYVKYKMNSLISKDELIMEGIVARSYPMMLFRDKSPIMFKLKVKDYEKLEQKEI